MSCHFENMPGNDYCGRCGTSLKLTEASISVQPPRAGTMAKHVRRWFPLLRAYRMARSERAFPTFAQWMPRGQWMLKGWSIPPDQIIRLALPGWAHWHQGRRLWGWIYFSAFAILILGGLLLYGTALGSMLLGLAFGVHSSYVIDATSMTVEYGGRWSRLLRGAFVALALAAVIYFPIGWLAMQIAEPVGLVFDAPPLKSGDVLLTHHFGTPKVGDIVVYDIPFQQISLANQYAYIGGRQMDRILAGPGSRVMIIKKQFYVDGQPSSILPLAPTLPDALDVVVPRDSFLIVPSTQRHGQLNIPISFWNEVSIVPRERIVATVYFRNQPWSRFGRLP